MNHSPQVTSAQFRLAVGARRGFSLIEMVLALSLVALIVGIGSIGYSNGRDERLLREATVRVEAMASRGHAMSILHQKAFWLRVDGNRVTLFGADISPQAPMGEEGESWDDWEEAEESPELVYEEYETEAQISLRRWGAGDDDWIASGEDGDVIWHFQSTGLCEPVSIRVQKDESWIVMHMHPLTARVEEEEMSIE
jgi:prepilin-type N-terminal cleavage/methylation domain-containing protein